MRAPRLQIDPPLTSGERTLDGDASHYLIRVLRRREGDAVRVFDGMGRSADARILQPDARRCVLELDASFDENLESPVAVHLGLALLKGERMDIALQKACELGVHAITPLRAARTEVRLEGKRLDGKARHWTEVLRHAAQQSGRTVLPVLHPVARLEDHLATVPDGACAFVMDPSGRPLDAIAPVHAERVHLLTGPEGGFDEAELSAADTHGWLRLSAGPRILRAETAPLVGLTLLHARFGDLVR